MSDINKEAIQTLIDTFKRLHHAPLPEHPDKGFNMEGKGFYVREYTQHSCGTAACIMGWERILDVWTGLKAVTGTGRGAALYMPRPSTGCQYSYAWHPEKFTLEAAIRVLQILRDTGEVRWNEAIDNPWSPDEEETRVHSISVMDMLMMDKPPVEFPEGPKRICDMTVFDEEEI